MTVRRLVSPSGKPKAVAPVRPNAGVQAAYQRKLDRLIDEMQRSVVYWVSAAYRAKPPEMAGDMAPEGGFGAYAGSPATLMREVTRRLARRWQRRFDEAAPELAKYFATAATDRADGALKATLDKAGFTVKFRLTAEANDVLQATVGENVALIKSIPAQYMTQVQGAVMRSVTAGRDLGSLTKALQEQHGVTKRRAAFIARDQNNKATASINRVRQQALGITEATWLHSGAGKHPRPTHVANSGKPYKIAEGWYDPALKRNIWPGTEPNCRCVAKSIIPGF